MKNNFCLFVIILFLLFTVSCQSKDNNEELSCGETAETDMLEITPTNIEIGTEDNQLPGWEVLPGNQIAVIDIDLKNISGSPLTIDRDFYYESFGIIVEGKRGIRQMDTNHFPFDGVFFGDLKAGEAVETRIVIFQLEGQMYLVFGKDGDLESGYEARWKID